MPLIEDYEQQVYAGVLGKVVGVYMGRPFENWSRGQLEEKWGSIDRYVHEDRNVPLVVSDDDISGTLTFVRAMEDSGLYAETPAEAFGDAWLNYVVENKSVFWWGGAGNSTEHTAYLRLKHGMKAPDSGSIATNGKVVAEQIGAQIFIDAFGLVAPGKPELAAELARRAASVSHDGEAVHAAVVVAAMVSAAFLEKDMQHLLDIALSRISADSTIAAVHHDVRQWCKEDGDWHRTYDRIWEKYGPSKYWGGPHVVPNHALMVMAWCYAPDDFHKAQEIVNTAGWDTDCNAGNVGAVMGLVVGLDGINRHYDFQSPMADRVVIPTAEGTRGVSDVLAEALHIARIGRKTMGWDPLPLPKEGATHHFEMPGALHGYMSEDGRFETRNAAAVSNVEGHSLQGTRTMHIEYRDVSVGRPARVSTPVLAVQRGAEGPYALMSTPKVYPGMRITMRGSVGSVRGNARACLFLRSYESENLVRSEAVELMADSGLALELVVPQADLPVQDLGMEITGVDRAGGEVFIDSVTFSGKPQMTVPDQLPLSKKGEAIGWISSMDIVGHFNFINDDRPMTEMARNEGRGVLITGTTDWVDCVFESMVSIHMADRAGIIVRYQGLERYIALVQTRGKLQLIRRFYGDTVLAEMDYEWPTDAWHNLRLECSGPNITAWIDGEAVLNATEATLCCGGAGYLCEVGKIGFRNAKIN